MNLSERATEIKGIFYTHCNAIINEPLQFDVYPGRRHPENGTITEEGIKFIDGSLLNFFEEIKNENIGIYSYEYIRPDTGYFFHYQNEGKENGIRKPLHHLHVGIMKENADRVLLEKIPKELIEHNGPHFVARINFHDFMGMIVANFFSNERNCEEMLNNLGF